MPSYHVLGIGVTAGKDDDAEGPTVAVEVVTAVGGAEHHGGVDVPIHVRLGPVARDGVPDETKNAAVEHLDEDAAVAAVEDARVRAVAAPVGE
jgi:hypothetical protein